MMWWLSETARKVQQSPWNTPDELWARIEPLLPVIARRADHPGRKRLDNRKGPVWDLVHATHCNPLGFLPQDLSFGSGVTCWRRLLDWQEAGVQQELQEAPLACGLGESHLGPQKLYSSGHMTAVLVCAVMVG